MKTILIFFALTGFIVAQTIDSVIIKIDIKIVQIEQQMKQTELNYVRLEGAKAILIQLKKELKEGDVLLLSPATASYDMFSDFRKRGETFKTLVSENSSS